MEEDKNESKKESQVEIDSSSSKGSSEQQLAKKRKKNFKENAIYGNYRNYYGYRIDQEMEEDPRFKVLKKEWFEGKDCLDIGCNSGLVTITIANKFCCRSILGIDIDHDRINDAYWNLKRIARMSACKKPSKASKLKDQGLNGEGGGVTEPEREVTNEIPGNSSAALLEKVSFKKENFVHSWWSPESNCYDTIICFSVTKWVHLNGGDDGLITLFAKIWRLLRPGGILVLEPQPWESYVKNRLVSEIASANYKNNQIRPDGFQEILLDKIGFRKIENITSGLCGTKSGFNRPILALWK